MTDGDKELVAALQGIAPEGAAVAAGRIEDGQAPLFPQEAHAVAKAVARRQAEFRAGRFYARATLRAIGLADQPIPQAADRRPVWPAGVVGSISHSATHCAAIATRAGGAAGLGLDMEPNAPLPRDLLRLICRPEELDLACAPITADGAMVHAGKLLFAAKEAGFKAQFPVTGMFLDFVDARVTLAAEDRSRFRIEVVRPDWHEAWRIEGRWRVAGGHLVAVVTLRRP